MELNKMKYKELNDYLTSHSVFGFTATKRKHTIIYTFRRFFNKINLILRVKVMRKSKFVMSVMHKDKVYTTFEDIKMLVEKSG